MTFLAHLAIVLCLHYEASVVYASSRFPTASPTLSLRPTSTPTTAPSTFITQLQDVNVFQCKGYYESFVVPEGVEALLVFMWGAGGYAGGNGAYVEGVLPVKAGQHVTVVVGQGGQTSGHAFGGGGIGTYGSGGGGRSALQINNEDVVTAGGGGGFPGGHATSFMNGVIHNVSCRGGDVAITTEADCYYGGGGSISVGGQHATCYGSTEGSKYQGGDGYYFGGGGGGYYGGGGGYYGGGGSSYLYNLEYFNLSDTSLTYGQCAGLYSKYISTCAGSCGTRDQNGCIVVEPVFQRSGIEGSSNFPTVSPSQAPTSHSPTLSPTSRQLEQSTVFQATYNYESFVVPEGVEALLVFMWGAGGFNGGNGAYVEGVLPVRARQHVTVVVGQGGQYSGLAFGGGGAENNGYGGGGGRSALQINNEDVVTAGGGSGYFGGHATSFMNGVIQNVSYRADGALTTEADCYYGGGGSISVGGQHATCYGSTEGSKYQGGDGYYFGGGGGGYYGGGGGYYGGGGSSYLYNLESFDLSDTSLTYGQCAGLYSKYISTCAGSCGTQYQDGCVVIEIYNRPSSSPSLLPTVAPSAPTNRPTEQPTHPTSEPTAMPTVIPTTMPTANPSAIPTAIPTADPTSSPTNLNVNLNADSGSISHDALVAVVVIVPIAVVTLILLVLYVLRYKNSPESTVPGSVSSGERDVADSSLALEVQKEVQLQELGETKEIGSLEIQPVETDFSAL